MGIEIAGVKVPNRILLMKTARYTADDSFITINTDSKSSVSNHRGKYTVRTLDSFTNAIVTEYPEEILIQNGVDLRIEAKTIISPKNREKTLVKCTIEQNYKEYPIYVECSSLMLAICDSEVVHGRIMGRIYLGFSNGICMAISEKKYNDSVRIDPDGKIRSRKPETTQYRIGGVYETQKKTVREVYLGKFYTHSRIISFNTIELYDDPLECHLLYPEYNVKDMGQLVTALCSSNMRSADKTVPSIIYNIHRFSKFNRPSRVDTGLTVSNENSIDAIETIVNFISEWCDGNLGCSDHPYIRTEILFASTISTENKSIAFSESDIDRLLGATPSNYYIKYKDKTYTGRLIK